MILVFDVGNSETTIGVFADDRVRAHFRVTTDRPRTPDEFAVVLRSLLESANIPLRQVTGAAICSVVPPATGIVAEACRRVTGNDPVSVDAHAAVEGRLPVKLPVPEPLTVGADRVANALAASLLIKRDTIVVDLGTATTFDCITADGSFFGGVIQLGLRAMAAGLSQRTAQLPAVAIAAPPSVIGTTTETCIQSGLVFGAAESIDGIVRRLKKEWPNKGKPVVIATGGFAPLMAKQCREIDRVEPLLTLHGIRLGFGILTSRPKRARSGRTDAR